jgi:CBS domain-containing protein
VGVGMKSKAKDIMTDNFRTLNSDIPISQAVRKCKKASEEDGRKVFGMMVTDDTGKLAGMISMYDILLFIRPKHIHIWGMMEDIDVDGLVNTTCERAKSILVGDIMTTDLVTVAPDTHLMVILEIMIKKHIRRIPVIEDNKAVGIVYISDLFYHLLDKLAS